MKKIFFGALAFLLTVPILSLAHIADENSDFHNGMMNGWGFSGMMNGAWGWVCMSFGLIIAILLIVLLVVLIIKLIKK